MSNSNSKLRETAIQHSDHTINTSRGGNISGIDTDADIDSNNAVLLAEATIRQPSDYMSSHTTHHTYNHITIFTHVNYNNIHSYNKQATTIQQ